jgi:type VII secretion integral membrane protein EccD
MTTSATGEMCRLVVCGPDRQIDVAVPAHVLVADLLPALLHHLGEGLADAGLRHGGWVLQRVGAAPLDEDSSVADLELRDGEIVHLRPRADQLPPPDFDDLIDGVAAGVRQRAGWWRPEMARWTACGLAGVLLALGLAVLGLPGPAGPRAWVAFAAAVACPLAAFVLARVVGERGFGTLVAAAGIGYAALGAATGSGWFAGALAGAVAAVVASVAVGRAGPLFAAVAAAALLAAVGGAGAAFFGLSAGKAAGVLAVAATMLVPVVPLVAFRLAGLRLTPLPTQPEHLQQQIAPEPSGPLLASAATTDRFMTGLYAGISVPTALAMVLLARQPGWAALALLLLASGAWLLAARPMTSAWHRLAQGVPAVTGLVAAALDALAGASAQVRLLAVAALPLAVAALVAAARSLPERRLMPYWGRIGDLTQTLSTVALFPVLLAILGVYGALRALGG